ncbi:DEKNAAC102054 [Brettanomyces naardenensis]|uniref:DEKNAAC102054 n=1 Tax=Brettanomyces naardenensis TaxID=13370 RepID=A0A448YJW1_BRENA|nr:DEKNAAC102054 [Brettanomyces naardenensis]
MMPVSPLRKRQRRAQRTLFALGEELALDRDGKAFGIRLENDSFPPGYRPSLYDDPTFFVVDNPPGAIARASEAIMRTFERDPNVEIYETYNLNLDGLQLKSLPEQISDFGHLVIYNKVGEITQPHLHLFASNNSLRSISPKIFDIGGLEGITLRDNKIARIPGAIGHAKSLRSINIAQNKIKFFPHTILNLPKLEIISVRPNKLIEIDDTKEVYRIDAKEGTPFNEPRRKRLRYVGKIRWITANKQISGTAVTAIKLSRNLSTLQDNSSFFNDESPTAEEEEQKYTKRRTFWCPRLSELVLRKISEYLISQSEVMKWRNTTHERVYKLAVKALIHGTNGEVCGYCENTVTEAVAELMEWWDLRDNSLLPIKRRFCCRRCAEMWLQSLPIEKNP